MLQPEKKLHDDLSFPYLKALHVQWFRVEQESLPEMWGQPSDIEKYGVKSGDLLVCEGGEGGRAAIIANLSKPCIIQNALHRVRSKAGSNLKFLQYVMFVISSTGWFDAICNKATIAHFTKEKFGSLKIAIPPIEEQTKIVLFLDEKIAKIDRFIANKQRMAALLREQKQAVITAAVTGKLDVCGKKRNAKDASGARDARAWFGDIPRHWEVRRLKTLFSIINGATPDSGNANYWDGDISWITPVDLHLVDGGIITNGRRNISELGYKNCGTTLLPSGSLVLSTRAPIGYVAITNNVLCTNQGCRGLIPKEQLNVEYFCFQLLALRPILQAFGNGSTFKELSTIPLGNLSVVKPSFQEQQEIVLYLKNTLHQIDRILARIEREIALMQEYRARLIADVVTGQIDAREKL